MKMFKIFQSHDESFETIESDDIFIHSQ